MASKSDRAAILSRLRMEIEDGHAIYDALCGSGITAKMAARGDASMVTTHSLAYFRMQGRIGAPKNTPAEIVDKLNEATNGALADRKLKTRLADLGVRSMPMPPADFGKFIAEETEKWGKVIRAANIKPE